MPKINHGSSMIVEDQLKKVLTRTTGNQWKFNDNKLIPRSQHSVFGDFPKEYLKRSGDKVDPVPKINDAELSIASNGKGKLLSILLGLDFLKTGMGSGGKTSSLFSPKDVPVV